MSNWKKISIWDAVNKVVFDDEWGFVRIESFSASINGDNNNRYYVKKANNHYYAIELRDINSASALSELFSQTVYRDKSFYYSRYNDPYIEDTVKLIELSVHVRRVYKDKVESYNYSNYYEDSFAIDVKNKEQLNRLRKVWICDELQSKVFVVDKFFRQPFLKDLKQGDEILYNNKRHLITKVYEQPNADGYMVAVKPNYNGADGEETNLSFKDEIYVLPYNEPPVSETARFNEYLDEFGLSPYAFKSGQCVNVYWNKLDDAAEYVVSVYKINNRQYRQKIYHIKDYVIDRNDGYVSLGDCIGEGYIVVVKAENRSGEIIAFSRGINTANGYAYPQYWE